MRARSEGIRKLSTNTSGYPGVTYDRSSGKYIARVYVDGKRQSIGREDTAEEAYRHILNWNSK